VEQTNGSEERAGARRPLDPVDLAWLQAAQRRGGRSNRDRYIALAVVVMLFLILLGIGVWLVSTVHANAPSALRLSLTGPPYSSSISVLPLSPLSRR
jgi:hypothetical protein